ncbi:hypothetical protein YC2023_029483 [Brassica napus]
MDTDHDVHNHLKSDTMVMNHGGEGSEVVLHVMTEECIAAEVRLRRGMSRILATSGHEQS